MFQPTAENVLIIEDDNELNEQIAQMMQRQGFRTTQINDGKQGLLTALKDRFDLILLDWQLPSLDGLTFLNKLRENRQTPVILLTGKSSQQARIDGYTSGADDYITKPFNSTELLLRINALLKRTRYMTEQKQFNKEHIENGALSLSKANRSCHYDNIELELTDIQFRLLWTLAQHSGETLSKPFLYKAVLAKDYSRYDRSLDMHLSRIRQKLLDAGMPNERLTTVHGKGYRFS
ncbi:response regulator transcription factor [Marinomonas epiphytica]